jgi:2-C-methyl-D-erythritol 4-phosphate cytidylyltransferase
MDSPTDPDADPQVWCVVVAAGTGSRFGGPKQFAPLGDSTVVEHSVGVAACACDGVVVVAHPGSLREVEDLLAGVARVVPGGTTRSESSRAGVEAVPERAGVILVHDAARPLASPALFRRVIAEVRGGADGAVPVVPVTDTIRDLEGELVDRDRLLAVQTPQGFVAEVLRRAVGTRAEATDDAALVARSGGTVSFVEGESDNRKITTREDLLVAEALLAARREHTAPESAAGAVAADRSARDDGENDGKG